MAKYLCPSCNKEVEEKDTYLVPQWFPWGICEECMDKLEEDSYGVD